MNEKLDFKIREMYGIGILNPAKGKELDQISSLLGVIRETSVSDAEFRSTLREYIFGNVPVHTTDIHYEPPSTRWEKIIEEIVNEFSDL